MTVDDLLMESDAFESHYRERAAGLPFAEYKLMRVLLHGKACIGDLAEARKVNAQGIGKMARLLAERNFVTVIRDPRDGRQKLVSLTKRGLRYCAQMEEWLNRFEPQRTKRIRKIHPSYIASTKTHNERPL